MVGSDSTPFALTVVAVIVYSVFLPFKSVVSLIGLDLKLPRELTPKVWSDSSPVVSNTPKTAVEYATLRWTLELAGAVPAMTSGETTALPATGAVIAGALPASPVETVMAPSDGAV